MRVLVFHGYLLRGTGSNVYNASLAPALADLGHEVHLFCQDRDAGELAWVDEAVVVRPGDPTPHVAGGAGTVSAYVPDIGGLLPVYVRDSYPGFAVKTFLELTDEELDRYIEANVAAVRAVVGELGGVDAALANHLVMGPVILARAGLSYAVKIHGSALEYTVKRDPGRFRPLAVEGLAGSNGVLVGSRHTAESLWRAIDDADLPARTRLGPPGVDTALFAPIDRDEAPGRLVAQADELEAEPAATDMAVTWGRDPHRAAAALRATAAGEGDRVIFVGKLIVSKGADLLLAAWPLAHAAKPGSRLLIVGFGEYEAALGELWAAFTDGDLERVREIAAAGRGLEGGDRGELEYLTAFLDELPDGYLEAAAAAAGSVAFAGRLEHDEVARIIPATDALVFPSTFPEAFGMVAAEAASAGVLPISAAHSGALEVSRSLAAALNRRAAELISFDVGPQAVAAIAARLRRWFGTDAADRAPIRAALAATASRLYGWEAVAEGVLAASAGELEGLPRVPGS